jgi:4'-phosphopantetheinyl transferase
MSYELSTTDIFVWLLPNLVDEDFESYLDVLADDERIRAGNYAFEADRNRFVIGRGKLRHVLGSICGVPPHSISFKYNQTGKPFLQLQREEELYFSVTHSGQIIGIAISSQIIGFDIEQFRVIENMESIASEIFSESEQRQFLLLSKDQRSLAFFILWTKKEALIKGLGQGVSYPLRDLNIGISLMNPNDQKAVSKCQQLQDWYLHNLSVSSQYAATIAFPSRHCDIKIFRDKFDSKELSTNP